MKKRSNHIIIFSLALIMAIGLAACGNKKNGDITSPPGENTDPKVLIVTGIDSVDPGVDLVIADIPEGLSDLTYATAYVPNEIAVNAISGTTATLPLYVGDDTPWTGTGNCLIMLQTAEGQYMYSNGKTLNELEIDIVALWAAAAVEDWETLFSGLDKFPRYNFNKASSTIPFDKFVQVM